jgi:tRNA (guanine-N7-)-methyltransferase
MESPPTVGAAPGFLATVAARKERLRTELARVLEGRSQGAVLEIGCGHGHFLVRYAQEFPHRFCLGLDIVGERLARAERKRVRAGLEHLCFVRAEATEAIECLPPQVRLGEVWVLFPDPWPKLRHHKHRLIQSTFLQRLAERMVPGGQLYFRTDHFGYAEWTRAVLAAHPDWVVLPDAPWPFEEETVFQRKASSYTSLVAAVRIRG